MQVAERMDASRFDLILLDPPFGQGWLPRLWPILPGILAEGGLVYVEAEDAIEPPEGFEILRQDKACLLYTSSMMMAMSVSRMALTKS